MLLRRINRARGAQLRQPPRGGACGAGSQPGYSSTALGRRDSRVGSGACCLLPLVSRAPADVRGYNESTHSDGAALVRVSMPRRERATVTKTTRKRHVACGNVGRGQYIATPPALDPLHCETDQYFMNDITGGALPGRPFSSREARNKGGCGRGSSQGHDSMVTSRGLEQSKHLHHTPAHRH